MNTSMLIQSPLGRYAWTLFELSHDHEGISESLKTLSHFFQEHPLIQRWIESFNITTKEAFIVWKEVSDLYHFSPLFHHFLCLLSQTKRIRYLKKIASLFEWCRSLHSDTLPAFIDSAHPLTFEDNNSIEMYLKKIYSKKIAMTTTINPTLLAGFIINVNHTTYDASYNAFIHDFVSQLRK